MSSDAQPNVAENDPPAREEIAIGGRVSMEDLRLIDFARVHAGYPSRAEFIEAAVLEKARAVLKDVSLPARAS